MSPLLSTVTIEEVEFDDGGILSPFPPTPLGGPASFEGVSVDPEDLVDESTPPSGDDAYVLAVHAVNPQVGPDPPLTKGSGGRQTAGSAATALSTIVGLRALAPGTQYEDVDVPIFETPQVKTFPGENFPPNPGGTTDVAVTLWYNTNPGEGFNFLPRPLRDANGNVIVDTAAIDDLGGGSNDS